MISDFWFGVGTTTIVNICQNVRLPAVTVYTCGHQLAGRGPHLGRLSVQTELDWIPKWNSKKFGENFDLDFT